MLFLCLFVIMPPFMRQKGDIRMKIIDSHVHIYPDKIAHKAVQSIGDFYQLNMEMDGTLAHVLSRSAEAGITRSLVHSVALTWERTEAINNFIVASVQAHPDRLTGFGSVHPDHPQMEKVLDGIVDAGLKGVKLHPDTQFFHLDDPAAIRLYEAMAERGLILLAHTGDHRYPYSQPERMARALDKVPSLTAICAHFGGWSIWNQAWKVLAGRSNVYVDTSSSLYAITPEEAVKIIHRYGASQVLFATDMPMWDPVKELERFNRLDLTEEERELILYKNFERLMGETDGE